MGHKQKNIMVKTTAIIIHDDILQEYFVKIIIETKRPL